jgi:tripartite-type tricarboxylate transporter receptor subunit TctC
MAQTFPNRPISLVVSFPAGGALNCASTGNGTALPIAGEMFKAAAGIDVQHVPYRGGGQAMTALLAGEVSYIIGNTQLVPPMLKAGRITALGVTADQPLPALPGVPTLAQAGVPGVDVVTWFGLFAPAGTPCAIPERLNAAAVTALRNARVRELVANLDDEPVGTSVAEFSAFARAEHERCGKSIRDAGTKLE